MQQVGTSLLVFLLAYFLVFGTGIYYMLKVMAKGQPLPKDGPDGRGGDTGKGDAMFDRRSMSLPTDPIDE